MSQPRSLHTIKPAAFVLAALSMLGGIAQLAWAAPAAPLVERIETCAVLQSYSGEVQIFNADHSGYLEPEAGGSIPCGGWVSTGEGHLVLKHRDGYRIQLGADSFAEVSTLSSLTPQHFVVYRGSGYFMTGEGAPELVVTTANGLARAKSGTFIVSYRKSQDETQVVSFSRDLYFANRFQQDQPQHVRSGEASSINFKRERAMPGLPRAVAHASLKEFAAGLELDERTLALATEAAKNRADRRLAADLKAGRSPASISAAKKGSYERHPVSSQDPELLEHFNSHIVGGSPDGIKILNAHRAGPAGRGPASVTGVPGGVGQIEVQDAARGSRMGESKKESAEKKRLIEELSKVRIE